MPALPGARAFFGKPFQDRVNLRTVEEARGPEGPEDGTRRVHAHNPYARRLHASGAACAGSGTQCGDLEYLRSARRHFSVARTWVC